MLKTTGSCASLAWPKNWLRRAAARSLAAWLASAEVAAEVRAVTSGEVVKSSGAVTGLGTLPRARAAKTGRRSEPAAVASRISARASVKPSAEPDSLDPEPDFDPEELEPEELEPEELEPEELEPEELKPDPDPFLFFLSCRGRAWSILSRLVRRSSGAARPQEVGVAEGRNTQRARAGARQCVGRPMVAGLVAGPWIQGLLKWPRPGPQVAGDEPHNGLKSGADCLKLINI